MSKSLNDYINEKRQDNPDLERELTELGNYTDLSIKIHQLRTSMGLSQRDLASKLGTSQVNVVRWETPGYTSYTVRTLEKLSRVFGVALKIDLEQLPGEIRIQKPYILAAHINTNPAWTTLSHSQTAHQDYPFTQKLTYVLENGDKK